MIKWLFCFSLTGMCQHLCEGYDASALTRQTHRHVRDLIAIIRNLIVIPCPRITLRRRVAILRHTRAAVSVTLRVGLTLARQTQRHVRDLIAVIRNLIAVACPHTTSCRRVAAP